MTCILKSSGETHFYTQDRNLNRHIIYHVTGFEKPFTAKQFNKLFKLNK